MRIIDRSLKTLRKLSVVEEEALRLFATGKSNAAGILPKIRESQHWLACDCSYPAPVMHVAHRDGGRYILKNNPDAADHDPSCSFLRTESTNKNSITKISHAPDRLSVDGHIALHVEFQSTRKGELQQISRSDAVENPRPRALLSLLMTIMETAELDTYVPANPRSLTEQYAAFRNAADRFVLKPGIPLSHVLDTKISKQRLVLMAKKLRQLDEFGQARRYGLLVDVMQKTGPRQLVLDDESTMEFFGNAEALHGRCAPMMTMATVASQEPGSSFYHLSKVAFVPLLSSRHLFPVVDSEDRSIVSDLFSLLRWMHEKRNISVTATRNIFQGGAGYLMWLRSGAKLLKVDLNPSSPLDGSPELLACDLSLHECGSMDALKKKVMAVFLKDVPRV